jgi:hypothetical protein
MTSVNNTRIKIKKRRSSAAASDSFSHSPVLSPRILKLQEKHKREKDYVFKMFKTKRAAVVDSQRQNVHEIDIVVDENHDPTHELMPDNLNNMTNEDTHESDIVREKPIVEETRQDETAVKDNITSNNAKSVFSKAFSSRFNSIKNSVKNMISSGKTNPNSMVVKDNTRQSLIPVPSNGQALKRANSACINPSLRNQPLTGTASTRRTMTGAKTSSTSLVNFTSNTSRMSSFNSSSSIGAVSGKPTFKVSQKVKYDDAHLYSNVC